MKKIFITALLLTCFLTPAALADDLDSGGINDVLKYTSDVENAFMGQKKVTDEDFQKALQEVKDKQNKKKKNKKIKGKTFNEENNGGFIKETADKNIVLTLPVELTGDDGSEIPVGHYKIVGTKANGSTYLDFYQSSTLVARIPATETNSDFDEKELNFVKLLPYSEKRVKVIYGSMDFNAYTFIKIKKEISDFN